MHICVYYYLLWPDLLTNNGLKTYTHPMCDSGLVRLTTFVGVSCFISCVLLLVLSFLVCNCCWLAVCIVVSCIVCIVVSCIVCIVVVVLCVLLQLFCVYCCHLMCIRCTMCVLLLFNLDTGLLARSQYSEGPVTGHLDTGFSSFPCVYNQTLRWFPTFQVATTCFSCSPPDLNLLVTNFIFCINVK